MYLCLDVLYVHAKFQTVMSPLKRVLRIVPNDFVFPRERKTTIIPNLSKIFNNDPEMTLGGDIMVDIDRDAGEFIVQVREYMFWGPTSILFDPFFKSIAHGIRFFHKINVDVDTSMWFSGDVFDSPDGSAGGGSDSLVIITPEWGRLTRLFLCVMPCDPEDGSLDRGVFFPYGFDSAHVFGRVVDMFGMVAKKGGEDGLVKVAGRLDCCAFCSMLKDNKILIGDNMFGVDGIFAPLLEEKFDTSDFVVERNLICDMYEEIFAGLDDLNNGWKEDVFLSDIRVMYEGEQSAMAVFLRIVNDNSGPRYWDTFYLLIMDAVNSLREKYENKEQE